MNSAIKIPALFLLLITGLSCSVKRYIPKGEHLYYGADINISKAPNVKTKTIEIRNSLAKYATPKRNKFVLRQPFKLWLWYKIGQPKKEKGFKNWLRNTIGEPPVFFSELTPEINVQSMQTQLENDGYFNSQVMFDTSIKKNKWKIVYDATVKRPYLVGKVSWIPDSSDVAKDLAALPQVATLLKEGNQYSTKNIKAEKDRLTQLMKDKGYYYFTPDQLLSYIDTNLKSYTANIYMAVKEPIPTAAKTPYIINRVIVRTPFSSFDPLPDSAIQSLPQQEGIYIADPAKKFDPALFPQTITFRTGQVYSQAEQKRSQVRLNSVGTFQYVRPQFTQTAGSVDSLDVTYYLSPYRKKKFQTDIGGFTRSNSYSGGELNIQWADKNFLKKAHNLTIKATGSFEITPNDSLQYNNNWRIGLETTYSIPKLLIPFWTGHDLPLIPRTYFPVSFDWIRHQDLYTEKYLHGRFELVWNDTLTRQYRLTPLSLTITNTANFTHNTLSGPPLDSAYKYVLPTIVIPSFGFQFIISNGGTKKHSTYLHAGVEFAGTTLGLIKGNHGYFSTKVANAYFMQFVKAGVDCRYFLKLNPQVTWANRIIIGTSYPYGNSPFLPFSRQYLIGGANSLRGFLPRHLGPGSAQATDIQQSAFPQIGGDYKLETSTEIRFPLAGRLKSAFFVDAGNIWMKDSVLYEKAGQLTKDFYKQIAMDAGLGLRIDVSILIIRLDLAMPFYKPWLEEGERWTFKDIQLGNRDWRKQNLIWNFALGYPF
ncbi:MULTISPECIES: translocation and assembly module lipoprotein TamL [Niastella]|uniref:BamA/TamA family outer membrane protein n=1 Tax=Niastella soli TaxID=2821487 RepID=A0ABS3YNE5_9BACT|nr:BamA/TamA family outer membrane protein [Niastella soli]MBO9199409.1 BamA/TamA family outer membrane protein [Niastella soli]